MFDIFCDFSFAIGELDKFTPKSYYDADSELTNITSSISLSVIAVEFGFINKPEFKTLAAQWDVETYLTLVLNSIDELFPIMSDAMEEGLLNGENSDILIEPAGLNRFSTEEWYDIRESLHDYIFTEDQSLLIFFKFLDQCAPEESWDKAASIFGWPIKDAPECLTRRNCHMDLDGLTEEMNKISPNIIHALDVATGAISDNPFFTFNPYEDACCYPVTCAAIRELIDCWEQAQEIMLSSQRAQELVIERPSLYRKILKVWDKHLVANEQEPVRLRV